LPAGESVYPPGCMNFFFQTLRAGVLFFSILWLFAGDLRAGRDDASRYGSGAAGWLDNGHRGDVEFGMWTHEAVAHGGAAGRFIGDSTLGAGDINTGGKSFGLYANGGGTPTPYAAATRKFAKPTLTTGDVLSFKISMNHRSAGNRGFDLRDAAGKGVFHFDVREGGYFINGDGGESLGGYDANTVFTFTFTQRERQVNYSIQRSGGIDFIASGNFDADSGSIADDGLERELDRDGADAAGI